MKTASFESLEYLFARNKKGLYAVSFKGSSCEDITDENFGKNVLKILRNNGCEINTIWSDEDRLFKETDVLFQLKKRNINGLQLDTHSSFLKEKIAKNNNIQLIVVPWGMQKKFENKLFFDAFLKKNKLPVPSGQRLDKTDDIKKIKIFPVVIQCPESDGSKGTFVVKSEKDFQDCIVCNNIKFPLLAREFIDHGLPIGVSLLIGPNKMIFSSLRLQAYFADKNGVSVYRGIQWLKKSFFPVHIIEALENDLRRLGNAMRSSGFRGIANVDLIIRNGKVFFIECNPRLGGATPQISFKPELLHGLDFVREFYKVTAGKNPSCNKPFIPNSLYQGFNFDIDHMMSDFFGLKIIKPWNVGFYEIRNGNLKHVSSKLKDWNRKRIFIYHALFPDTDITKEQFFGFAMIHTPLLDIKDNKYSLNITGVELSQNLLKLIKNSVKFYR